MGRGVEPICDRKMTCVPVLPIILHMMRRAVEQARTEVCTYTTPPSCSFSDGIAVFGDGRLLA